MSSERCTWCGNEVGTDEGYRLVEHAGRRSARFCRLEHVVPWAIRGAHWVAGEPPAGAVGEHAEVGECSHCGRELGDARLVLVRHRAEHRIADGFCGVDHLLEWAKAGGRWR